MDPDLGDLTEELALVWQMEKDSQSVPSAHFTSILACVKEKKCQTRKTKTASLFLIPL